MNEYVHSTQNKQPKQWRKREGGLRRLPLLFSKTLVARLIPSTLIFLQLILLIVCVIRVTRIQETLLVY